MQIHRSASHTIDQGPAEYFTGTVRIERLVDAPAPARVAAVSVTFAVDWLEHVTDDRL